MILSGYFGLQLADFEGSMQKTTDGEATVNRHAPGAPMQDGWYVDGKHFVVGKTQGEGLY